MVAMDNGNDGTNQEKLAPVTNQSTMNDTPVEMDSYCPPVKPTDANDSQANEKYETDLELCKNHLLREVRIEVHEVIRILNEHVAGNLDIKSHLAELDSSKIDIDTKLNELKAIYLCRIAPEDFYSEIFNIWQVAQGNPYLDQSKRDEFLRKPEQERLREVNLLKNRLSRLSFLIEYSTVLERINNWVNVARPGYALPFHTIFEDEVASPEDRQKILNLYSLQPESIKGGLIDPVRGVILCYPLRSLDRFVRHAISFLFFVITFLVVYYAGFLLSGPIKNLLDIQQQITPTFLLMCWTAMLIGIGGHVLVTGAKSFNVEFRQFPLPLRDWDYYLSARTSMILYKTTLSVFVFLSMFVLLNGKMAVFEAFLMGYSFDSVVDLIGVSLEKRSSSSVSAIKKKLSAAE